MLTNSSNKFLQIFRKCALINILSEILLHEVEITLAPVTPVTETQYIKEPAFEAKYAMRLSEVVGDTRGIYDNPKAVAMDTNDEPSSGGRSTTTKPSIPKNND